MPFRFIMLIAGILASVLFFVFGIHAMIMAYRAGDPFTFLMLFFSSSFVILLSAAMGVVFLFRIHAIVHKLSSGPPEEE